MLNGVSQSHQPPAYCRPSTCTPCRMRRARCPAPAPPPASRRRKRGPSGCARAAIAPAEFEGDAAEHQAEQHRDHRRVERRHQHRVGQRKRRHQPAAAEHQPGFVAVPDRRDAVHDDVAIAPFREQRKQDAEAEVETVHHDVDEHAKAMMKAQTVARSMASMSSVPLRRRRRPAPPGVMPAARAGGSLRGPCSPRMRRRGHQAQEVEDAGAEHREIDDDEGHQRGADRGRRQRRGRSAVRSRP